MAFRPRESLIFGAFSAILCPTGLTPSTHFLRFVQSSECEWIAVLRVTRGTHQFSLDFLSKWLEIRCTGNGTVGSNPTHSAKQHPSPSGDGCCFLLWVGFESRRLGDMPVACRNRRGRIPLAPRTAADRENIFIVNYGSSRSATGSSSSVPSSRRVRRTSFFDAVCVSSPSPKESFAKRSLQRFPSRSTSQ